MPAPDMKALNARAARFKDLKSSSAAFVDTRIPEYSREIVNIVGRDVTENPLLAPPSPTIATSTSPC